MGRYLRHNIYITISAVSRWLKKSHLFIFPWHFQYCKLFPTAPWYFMTKKIWDWQTEKKLWNDSYYLYEITGTIQDFKYKSSYKKTDSTTNTKKKNSGEYLARKTVCLSGNWIQPSGNCPETNRKVIDLKKF